ncbi:MAG: hypothetical protein MUE90_06045 [Thermoanaerobaculales bacterium]|nr:hypothetical protein [Thermoanaerobaculales bacterium]
MVDKDEIRRLYEWLQARVTLRPATDGPIITFDEPARSDFEQEGFADELVSRSLGAAWWREMVTEIIETPDFAEPGDPPEQVLGYARDVVREYIWKRLY